MSEDILKSLLGAEIKDEEKINKILEGIKVEKDTAEAVKAVIRLLDSVKASLPTQVYDQILLELAQLGYAAPAPQEKSAEPVKEEPKVEPAPGELKKGDELDLSVVPEALRSQVEGIWKERAEAVEKAAKAEKELATIREEKVCKEFTERAKVFKNLSVKDEELGQILKDISEKSPESFQKLEGILKAADEAISRGTLLNKEIGAPETVPVSGGAVEKIESIAKELVSKGEAKNLAEARAMAWTRNQGLYNEYMKEKGGN